MTMTAKVHEANHYLVLRKLFFANWFVEHSNASTGLAKNGRIKCEYMCDG